MEHILIIRSSYGRETILFLVQPCIGYLVLINNGTPTTKVINVRYINKSVSEDPTDSSWTAGSNEEDQVLVSVYRDSSVTNDNKGNTSNYTNTTEDLDLRTYVGGSNATMVFANRDSDEFTSLAYNWCLNRKENSYLGFAGVVVIKVSY